MFKTLMLTAALVTLSSVAYGQPIHSDVTGHYYEPVYEWITWEEANTAANAAVYNDIPGHLLTLSSAEEALWLVDNIESAFELQNIWLGAYQLSDMSSADEGWQWVTGEPFEFTNWDEFEPNDLDTPEDNSENHLAHSQSLNPEMGWMWNDLNGENLMMYVIEYGVDDKDEETTACLVAINNLEVADRVEIDSADMYAGNEVNLGVCADVEGDISVDGNLESRDQHWCGTSIDGDVTLSGIFKSQNGNFTITGDLNEGAEVTPIDVPTVSVNPGTESQWCPAGAVPPGSYNDVAAWGGCTLTLTSGTYIVNNLYVWADAALQIDDSAGPVIVLAQNSFFFGDRVDVVGISSPDSFIVYTNQQWDVGIGTDSNFIGHIFAPSTRVSVYSRSEFNGCIAARDISIQPDVLVVGADPVEFPVE